jgi:hypothetical protein
VQGRTLEIRSRSADVFTVADPSDHIASLVVGTRVSIGGRYFDNLVDQNTVDLFHATAAKSGFNTAGQTFSRIERNLFYDTPNFPYPAAFHLRTDHQCIMIRSAAGPYGVPAFSFHNSIVGNTCQDAGDISATVVSWGTYEVNSPTWISGNTFTGSPLGQLHRYKGPGVATRSALRG